MINIHNFYGDIIETFYNYLKNNVIHSLVGFESNLINPGLKPLNNRHPNQKLPFILFELNDTNQDESRQVIEGFAIGENFGQKIALHNHTKDLSVILQEDWVRISITATINCDSQLQALDIKHHLMTFFPLNNPLNYYEFSSFFKLPEYLIDKKIINPETDHIQNLYCMNHSTSGKYDYFYSVGYNPLIEVNSMDIQMSDANSTSFQVAMGIDFLTNIPIRMIYPWLHLGKVDKFGKKVLNHVDDVLVTTKNSDINYVLYLRNTETRELEKKYIYLEKIEYEFGRLDYTLVELKYKYNVIHVKEEKPFDFPIELYYTDTKIFKFGSINSFHVNGKVYNPTFDKNNNIEVYFEGEIDGIDIKGKLKCIIQDSNNVDIIENMTLISANYDFINGHPYMINETINNLPTVNVISTIKEIMIKSIDDNPVTYEKSKNGKFDMYPDIIFDLGLRKLTHYGDYKSIMFDLEIEYDESYNIGVINNINIDFNDGNNTISTTPINYDENISDSYNIVIKNLITSELDSGNILLHINTIFRMNDLSDIKWIMNIPNTDFHISSNTRVDENDKKILFLREDLIEHHKLTFEIDEDIYHRYFRIDKNNPLFFYIKR